MARADAVTTMLETLEARAMVDVLQYAPTRLVLYNASRLQPLAPRDLAQVQARAERAMQWSNPARWSISNRSVYSPVHHPMLLVSVAHTTLGLDE